MPSGNIAGLIYMYFHNTKSIGRTKNKLFFQNGSPYGHSNTVSEKAGTASSLRKIIVGYTKSLMGTILWFVVISAPSTHTFKIVHTQSMQILFVLTNKWDGHTSSFGGPS